MENRRFILIALLGVVLFFLYQAWQDDYGKSAVAKHATPAQVSPATSAEPQVQVPGEAGSAPSAVPLGDAPIAVPAAAVPEVPVTAPAGQTVKVVTDVMNVEISLRGGELRRLELAEYPISKNAPDVPLPLLSDRDGQFFIFQSGLAGTAQAVSSGDTVYTAAQTEYRLAEGTNGIEVVLEHTGEKGLSVRKVYRFTRSSYRVELEQSVDNGGSEPLTVSPYARFTRNTVVVGDLPKFVATFLGVGFYEKRDGKEGYKFVKTKLDNLDDDAFEKRQPGGWIVMMQHYFLAGILPSEKSEGVFSAKPGKEGTYAAQYVGTGVAVAPGASQTFPISLYVGPKLQTGLVSEGHDGGMFKNGGLDTVARGLDYTVDYGILTPICEPLFWLLSKFHSLTGNWGVAIILLTLVVKGLFYKLSEKQYRSMAKMKKFGPRIQDIKERYGGDREKMSKAMMDLYKKEGFNPLAGCWPLLVQFPVFIALYWVLLESVELRQADFALWINDLSAPDPFYVLPVLFGITFYIQQKWSGSTATMDPMQQKIMNVMPIMMTAFFAFFQAGLVLYWFVSNIIGMAQQWFINRKLEGEGLGKAKPA
ncbi:MAG: membrane protein insertase YidC [Panacagrimonas sp.]